MHALAKLLPLKRAYEKSRREQTRQAAAKRKMTARLSKGEKANAKRMATVASVYTLPPRVRAPEDIIGKDTNHLTPPSERAAEKRVWAKLEKDPESEAASQTQTSPTEKRQVKRQPNGPSNHAPYASFRSSQKSRTQIFFDGGHIPTKGVDWQKTDTTATDIRGH
jgi:hypothetical protein